MNERLQSLNIGGYRCELCLPAGCGERAGRYPAVYLNGAENLAATLREWESCAGAMRADAIFIAVQPHDWNADFTPWPAPALKKDGPPFGGGAAAYLDDLLHQIKPFVDTHYPVQPESAALVGYSLGGLAALYALYRCDAFSRVGCLSGSLWYDGWVDYMQHHTPARTDARVYLSLGTGETHSRNPRMAQVGECTRQAAGLLSRQLDLPQRVTLEWNPGGHFADIPRRFAKAFARLLCDGR